MFYCGACGGKLGWPKGISCSSGPCELCGRVADCSDVPSSLLPTPKVPRGRAVQEPPPFHENPDYEKFYED